MEMKEAVKKIFKLLKEDLKINNLFNECNRQLVLGISAGDKHPRVGTLQKDINGFPETQYYLIEMNEAGGDMGIRKYIGNDTPYRYCHISLPAINVELEYFVVLGDVDSNLPVAETSYAFATVRDKEEPVAFATMVIAEKHDCANDDTLGKIIKHELTHLILGVLDYSLDESIYCDEAGEPLFDDGDDEVCFEEFLCDYIQWDSAVSPGEDPIEKFEDIMKKYLTWLAADVYTPYLEAVREYYIDVKEAESSEGGDD